MGSPNLQILMGQQAAGGDLYDFTSAYFTVSRALADSFSTDAHRYGPNITQVRSWLSGTSNGGGGHDWATQYVDMPLQGYQRWTVPKDGTYRIRCKGASAGLTDQNWRGRGAICEGEFPLTGGEQLILVAGQGVPDYSGDHCNGAGGASWACRGSSISSAIPLVVGAGAGSDTSDGSAKVDGNTTFGSIFTTQSGGFTGKQTEPVSSAPDPAAGNGGAGGGGDKPASGGWLTDGVSSSPSNGRAFRTDLVGGVQSNATAGNGGFGGGSGGHDENGSAGGGFTGAVGVDDSAITGHGSSAVNTQYSSGGTACSLAPSTAVYQDSDYTSQFQFHGWVYVQLLS